MLKILSSHPYAKVMLEKHFESILFKYRHCMTMSVCVCVPVCACVCVGVSNGI